MELITENLLVQDNEFGFAVVENGLYTDTGSIFINNSASKDKSYNAAVLYGTRSSL